MAYIPNEARADAAMVAMACVLVDLDNLVGAVGVTTTPLGPGGKARFGNHLVERDLHRRVHRP